MFENILVRDYSTQISELTYVADIHTAKKEIW